MEMPFTPDQQAFVREAIAEGRLHDELEAVRVAMGLWEERERVRAEILAGVDEAEASVARGEGIPITRESMRAMVEEIKQEGRAYIAAQKNTLG